MTDELYLFIKVRSFSLGNMLCIYLKVCDWVGAGYPKLNATPVVLTFCQYKMQQFLAESYKLLQKCFAQSIIFFNIVVSDQIEGANSNGRVSLNFVL